MALSNWSLVNLPSCKQVINAKSISEPWLSDHKNSRKPQIIATDLPRVLFFKKTNFNVFSSRLLINSSPHAWILADSMWYVKHIYKIKFYTIPMQTDLKTEIYGAPKPCTLPLSCITCLYSLLTEGGYMPDTAYCDTPRQKQPISVYSEQSTKYIP